MSTIVYVQPTRVPFFCRRCKKTGIYLTKIHWLDLQHLHQCGHHLQFQSPREEIVTDYGDAKGETYHAGDTPDLSRNAPARGNLKLI